jgi:hypothetical protein
MMIEMTTYRSQGRNFRIALFGGLLKKYVKVLSSAASSEANLAGRSFGPKAIVAM